jgi:hypothetical protein
MRAGLTAFDGSRGAHHSPVSGGFATIARGFLDDGFRFGEITQKEVSNLKRFIS